MSLSKNSNFEKYKYSGHGFGIQARESFSLSDGSGFGKNVLIFVAHMISSRHVGSKKRNLNFCSTQGLGNTTLTAEKKYAKNFSEQQKEFV